MERGGKRNSGVEVGWGGGKRGKSEIDKEGDRRRGEGKRGREKEVTIVEASEGRVGTNRGAREKSG